MHRHISGHKPDLTGCPETAWWTLTHIANLLSSWMSCISVPSQRRLALCYLPPISTCASVSVDTSKHSFLCCALEKRKGLRQCVPLYGCPCVWGRHTLFHSASFLSLSLEVSAIQEVLFSSSWASQYKTFGHTIPLKICGTKCILIIENNYSSIIQWITKDWYQKE